MIVDELKIDVATLYVPTKDLDLFFDSFDHDNFE